MIDPAANLALLGRLKTQCRETFDGKLIGLLDSGGPLSAAQTHQAAAEAAFETLRAHYKGRLKTSNKSYDPSQIPQATPDKAAKMRNRIANAPRAEGLIGSLAANSQPVQASLALGVGNCGTMTEAAVALVRSLGVPAEEWRFDDETDPHHFCVVGAAPSSAGHAGSSTQDAPPLTEADIMTPRHFVVDVWSGIQCKASEFKNQFRAKMDQWAQDGKTIDHVVPDPVEFFGKKMTSKPNDPAWLRSTVDERMAPVLPDEFPDSDDE